MKVKYLTNKHEEAIIVDNSKIKNACDHNEEVTAIFEEAFHVPKSLDTLKNPFYWIKSNDLTIKNIKFLAKNYVSII